VVQIEREELERERREKEQFQRERQELEKLQRERDDAFLLTLGETDPQGTERSGVDDTARSSTMGAGTLKTKGKKKIGVIPFVPATLLFQVRVRVILRDKITILNPNLTLTRTRTLTLTLALTQP
jgi:hypothetical protein